MPPRTDMKPLLSLFLVVPAALALSCYAQEETSEVPSAPAAEENAAEEAETETPEADETTSAETAPEQGAESADDAELLQELRRRFGSLAALLEQVQDAAAATELGAEVRTQFEASFRPVSELMNAEEADEERLAAEIEEAFAPVDAQLARLEEADFYGDAALRAVFAAPDEETPAAETESGVVYPVGLFDFLRGDRAEQPRVCPREDDGLHFFDWNAAE